MTTKLNSQEKSSKVDWHVGKVHETILSNVPKADKLRAYAEWSNTYDKDIGNLKYSGPKHITQMLFEAVRSDTIEILDAGCGTGLLAPTVCEVAADKNVSVKLTGLDYSQAMLDQASKKNLYENLVQADLNMSLPFPENHFDFFIAGALFLAHHCGPSVLPNIFKCVKVGGFGVFSIRRNTYLEEGEQYLDMLNNLNCNIISNEVRHYLGPTEANYIVAQKAS